MLGDHLVFPILLSKDLAKSRDFYHDTLGLEILREDDERIIFRCGAGSQLSVTLSTTGTSDTQTQLAWRVPDLKLELADLRARGVRIESYDAPDPITDADGIADMGFAWSAWIIDPDANALAIIQPKAPSPQPGTSPARRGQADGGQADA
ncbi:MAG TPA: VOC family protein [Candidatus Limnocylindrales bacterium]|jgi:catechol 2,3-dioxygenase-like lactoylglutathione lyase family enzyme